MLDQLRAAMRAVEDDPAAGTASLTPALRFAVLSGLGSKYLAVGAPSSLGIIDLDSNAEAIVVCHRLLFGELEVKRNRDMGVEEALAADIVCLPATTDFELEWIAEATHLNILDASPHSRGMAELTQHCALTYLDPQGASRARSHGLLAEVIRGSVSGRMGEEITALLA